MVNIQVVYMEVISSPCEYFYQFWNIGNLLLLLPVNCTSVIINLHVSHCLVIVVTERRYFLIKI
jgi:hypothetical protein